MSEIKNLAPKAIWHNFYLLTQVPRPSGHLEKIQKFLLDWAKERNIEAFQDKAGNIIMRKPATPGMEDRKLVTMQGHMDMVPQKAKDSKHDFLNDPIETWIDGEWVKTKGTTLGADDGMAVAAIMAVMEDDTIPHARMEYQEVDVDPEDAAVRVNIHGLLGGHSGLEINLGRANANKLMARLVQDAIANYAARLATWYGGNMRNAIPNEAEVVLTLPKENVEAFKEECVTEWRETFKAEYGFVEEKLDVEVFDHELPSKLVPEEIQDNLVDAIYGCHNGVFRFIPETPHIVETSSNLAIIEIGGGKVFFKILIRSSRDSMKECLAETLGSIFSMAGLKVALDGDYPAWQPNMKSEIVELMRKIYKDLFGNDNNVEVIHAGLECGVIGAKYPKMDMVSFGPTLRSPHTANERCHIPSVDKYWVFLKEILAQTPKK